MMNHSARLVESKDTMTDNINASMRKKTLRRHMKRQATILLAFLLIFAFLLTSCSSGLQLSVQAFPGYQISLFASGTPSYQNPDGVAVDQGHVFLDYANITKKDGTDHKTSTIVEYDMHGQVLKTFAVSGHSDGLRVDPTTHFLWALSNENANPVLTIIDPTEQSQKEYKFPPTPHQHGYDDLYFLKDSPFPFISASNPTLDGNGQNNYPLVYQITDLVDGNPGIAHVAPILQGHASATDIVTNATVTLNEIDPDSLSEDTQGDLVLINEDGNEIVFISHPGTPQQRVSRLRVGAQLDDTVWIPSAHGRLLVVDAVRNQTYWMDGAFKPGAVYTETTDVQSVVEQLDPSTGIVTTVATGFLKPTGLLFVPG